jgi:hypothetical protein
MHDGAEPGELELEIGEEAPEVDGLEPLGAEVVAVIGHVVERAGEEDGGALVADTLRGMVSQVSPLR